MSSPLRRLAFISPAAGLGGAERCLLDFVACVQRERKTVTVLLVSLADGPLIDEARKLGVEVAILPLPGALASFGESNTRSPLSFLLSAGPQSGALARFLPLLARTLSDFDPDLVHTNGMKAHVLSALVVRQDVPLVVHLHDFVSTRRVSRYVLPQLARRRGRTTFIANSQAVASDFGQLAPGATVRVVSNAVDTDYFAPAPGEPAWLARLAGLTPPRADSVSFGLIASYARWKGHHFFIDAAARFFAHHPTSSVRFYIAGGPIYATHGSQVSEAELLDHITASGLERRLGLIPFQPDVVRVFRALDVIVHSSTEPEPFGRTIVEGMSCARPVLVANAGGAAELFIDGVNGLGYEAGNVAALCEHMKAVAASAELRSSLGAAGREWAVERFSRARLGPELLRAFGDT